MCLLYPDRRKNRRGRLKNNYQKEAAVASSLFRFPVQGYRNRKSATQVDFGCQEKAFINVKRWYRRFRAEACPGAKCVDSRMEVVVWLSW